MRSATFLVLLVGVLTACGAGSELPAAEESTTTSAAISTEMETTTMNATGPEGLPVVAPARIDLAERLGVDPEELEVVTAEKVTWPDGSLGCPEPGMFYTQAVVDGSKVVLGYEGRVYVYHAGADDEPFLCPSEENDGGYELVPPPGFND